MPSGRLGSGIAEAATSSPQQEPFSRKKWKPGTYHMGTNILQASLVFERWTPFEEMPEGIGNGGAEAVDRIMPEIRASLGRQVARLLPVLEKFGLTVSGMPFIIVGWRPGSRTELVASADITLKMMDLDMNKLRDAVDRSFG